MRFALLYCALALVAFAAFGQAASQPTGKHSAARALQGKPKQDQGAPRLDTSSLERTIRDAVREAGEKQDPHADEKLHSDRKLVEYTSQLAVDTHRLAEFTFWLFVVAGGTAAIVFGQLCMFWRQLWHMKEDSKSTKAAAEAAKASADAALLSLRPWLSCEIELGEPLTFNPEGDAVFAFHFIVKNVGHSPAMAVQFLPSISLFEFRNRSMAHLKTMADWNRDKGVNPPTILIPSGFSMGREEIGPIIFPGVILPPKNVLHS